MSNGLLAGVELGGTKCVCILGTGPDDVRAQERVATGDPESTLTRIEQLLDQWSRQHGRPVALGIASFGPVDLKPGSPTHGFITATPKPLWNNTDVAGRLTRRLNVPVGVNTDVNGAALGEGRWGAAQGLSDFVYITVGTGIGVGLIVNGAPVFGCSHSEMGHIRIVRMAGDDWPGACAFHGDCVEGLASGPAIEARAETRPDNVPSDHFVWRTVAHALGQLLHSIVLTTAPQRIVLGGGVMTSQLHLFARVRAELQRSLNGYLAVPEITRDIEQYVVPPALGGLSGALGALVLAANAQRPLDASGKS